MYVAERLADHHQLDRFDSGQPGLDDWRRRHARTADAKRIGRTYVWHRGDDIVLAYFTLCPHVLVRAELPTKLGRGDPMRIPAILLARLVLNRTLHGQRLGAQLLLDALCRAVAASNDVGGRYVVVEVIDEPAARFYEHHNFHRCPGTSPIRLIRRVTDIAATLG